MLINYRWLWTVFISSPHSLSLFHFNEHLNWLQRFKRYTFIGNEFRRVISSLSTTRSVSNEDVLFFLYYCSQSQADHQCQHNLVLLNNRAPWQCYFAAQDIKILLCAVSGLEISKLVSISVASQICSHLSPSLLWFFFWSRSMTTLQICDKLPTFFEIL